MKNKKLYRIGLLKIVVCILLGLSACQVVHMQDYYIEKGNYVTAKGIIESISYDEENRSVYIDFSLTSPKFDDTCFKIVGDNYDIVIKRGIKSILKQGNEITFVTAPRYFGDGYVMPIVSVSTGGEMLLEFDEGVSNLISWLDK